MLRYLPFLLVLALWIYAFIDCLNTPEEEVKGLPKVVWIIIVLLFGEVLVGPVAWLVAGKARRGPGAGPSRWTAPDDNPAFLASLGEGAKGDGAMPKDHEALLRDDEALLQDWEADLRRREEELKRRERGEES
ncbi:PLD nuclease N-terminal domain-containing protein [Streptomyces sp. ASQP_92]|uniref:PLD nuclease N-terminal domain-containing protein n=1 Tax=Streptomyces sp. ASQP_92 TaxID=2979116 RepID=UPI0021BFE7E6|nr:PLD nuclease N-terminal domain-containing protein [Streptomyces sp. ASQP_92]MCT9089125.1 PLD nuclease N-terminal domain-containing protein [Streptomyces sp. ASQP_92]